MGYQDENQILTQLRFIHNGVVTGNQWMDDALVGCWFNLGSTFSPGQGGGGS
jgi:hypothetical protein